MVSAKFIFALARVYPSNARYPSGMSMYVYTSLPSAAYPAVYSAVSYGIVPVSLSATSPLSDAAAFSESAVAATSSLSAASALSSGATAVFSPVTFSVSSVSTESSSPASVAEASMNHSASCQPSSVSTCTAVS